MKKILLLSALLILACSSDDSSDTNDNNNTSSQKLIESLTLHSIQTCETYGGFTDYHITNCNYNDNNLITSLTSQFYEFSCPDNFYYREEKTENYEYFEGYVVASSNGGVNQIDLNENGNVDTYNLTQSGVTYVHNITYENGYIERISRVNGYFESQFNYENGNLINTYSEFEDGDIYETNITYTQYENKSKLYHPFLSYLTPYFPVQNFYGKNNTNLPATFVRNRYNSDGELVQNDTEYYNYIFDDDGYVIFVELGSYSDYNDYNISNSLIEITYKLTYTN